MNQKTNNYDKFKLRDDNRVKINQAHVRRLISSIQSRNLLEIRPIIVNQDFEVIDGQHRLMAAKALGVDIYYKVENVMSCNDIILLNTAKTWVISDYLNYYCKNQYIEYQKLAKFIEDSGVALKVALSITMGQSKTAYADFKSGQYKFNQEFLKDSISHCWDTIAYIKKMNGFSLYTSSVRFWSALLRLVKHHDYDHNKWMDNLKRMVERFGPRATIEDYLRLITEVYNWRNSIKIDLIDKN